MQDMWQATNYPKIDIREVGKLKDDIHESFGENGSRPKEVTTQKELFVKQTKKVRY